MRPGSSAGKKSGQSHIEVRGPESQSGVELSAGRTWGGGGLLIRAAKL